MPVKCGIDLNISNLQSEITSKLSGFVNLSGTLGTPAGLATIKAQLSGAITSIKGKVQALIPEIPTVPQSLREDLAALAALPVGGVAALAKIAQFATDYVGITDLKGFANINLNDLASSVFSVSGTFDPCSALLNIPNVIKDPVTGALVKLPSIQPKLGTTAPALAEKTIETVTNTVKAAFADNAEIKITDSIATTLKNIQTNISPAPVVRPPDELLTLPSGLNAWGLDGTIPKEMQSWSTKDVEGYLRSIIKLNKEGKVGPGAVNRAYAVKRFHAEKYRLFQNNKVTEWKAEHPEFDDPSSPDYRMLYGRFLITEGTDDFSGKFAWKRV